jgi:hypothetical protein
VAAVIAGAARAGEGTPRGIAAIAAGTAALFAGALMLVAALAGIKDAALGDGTAAAGDGGLASALAERDIPPQYLHLYQDAAQRYGLDWAILAGIGKVECNHGRDPAPSCTREGISNGAGAGGPMQFLASTWAQYGVDGNGDGRADRWDPPDAVYSAANYLRSSGAPAETERAILAYNHARWYVAEVERWAALYRGQAHARGVADEEPVQVEGADWSLQGRSPTPVLFVPGTRAILAPSNGRVALIPAGVPGVVQAMVIAGNELQGLRYGPGGHPDPRGVEEEDCSSTVTYVLYRSGVRPIAEILRENPLAQDYVHWGTPGRGRWVSVYSTTAPTNHVFIVIAGLRLDTSHNGTDEGPNRREDGPRWRVLGRIPDWAHWSVRHPPGL